MSGQFYNQHYNAMSSNNSRHNVNDDEELPTVSIKRSTSTEVKIEPETSRQEECKREAPILSSIGNLMGPPTNYKRPSHNQQSQQSEQAQYASIPKELYMFLYQNIKKKVIQDLYLQMAAQAQVTNNNTSFLVKRKMNEGNEQYENFAKKVQLTQEKGVYSNASNNIVKPPTTPTTTATTPTTESQPGTPKKARKRISMSQNYKGVLTRGFARTIVQSKEHPTSEFYKKFHTILSIHQQLSSGALKEKSLQDLENVVFRYIKDNIQGKVSYQTKNNKEAESSKINSNTQIKKVFFNEGTEDIETAFSKKVAFDMMIYFLSSCHFDQWVKGDCQSTEENKDFLLLNKDEFRKVFESPISYKPKFRTPSSHSDE